jgi:large subunit ribosomal protein L22
MKRIRPAPMGRAFRYQRRIAHIIITVAEKNPTVAAEVAEAPAAHSIPKTAGKTAGKKTVAKKSAAKKAAPKKKAAAK